LVLRDAAGRAAFAPAAAAGDAVVLSQFAASKAANGYDLSPSGIIRQWGYYAGAASKGSISFASSGINFPTACVNVQFTPIYDKDGGFGATYIVQLDALPTTTGFAFNSSTEDLGTDDFILAPIPFLWSAVGY
ncbi:MAG: hypothetical protein Q7U75_07015, partial [Desulfobacterales bacterium]|nr:hypothetical protein [Desulfobacterales bacterium]